MKWSREAAGPASPRRARARPARASRRRSARPSSANSRSTCPPPTPAWRYGEFATAKPADAGAGGVAMSIPAAPAARRRPGRGCTRCWAAIRSGTARRAAVRAADRRARPERVKVKFGFGDPPFVMLEKKDDGTWGGFADYPPPSPVELQLRRVRGRGSRWLREAGQGVGARRSPVPARASVGEQ